MYKLLALDIDDTLLNSQGRLSQANKIAIGKAAAAGVTVTIATGRSYIGARRICEEIGLQEIPVITFGGAQINDYPSDRLIMRDVMERALLLETLDFAKEEGRYIQFYDGDLFLYERECEESAFYAKRLGYPGRVANLREDDFPNSAKALMIVKEDEVESIARRARERFGDRLQVLRSYSTFIEFYMPKTSKGNALRWLGDHLGISMEETIAVGDTGIDVPMLETAGLGIAVANAFDDAKAAADLVYPATADEDAVSRIIDEYFLQERSR